MMKLEYDIRLQHDDNVWFWLFSLLAFGHGQEASRQQRLAN